MRRDASFDQLLLDDLQPVALAVKLVVDAVGQLEHSIGTDEFAAGLPQLAGDLKAQAPIKSTVSLMKTRLS
jgi:hypothetical protein